MTDPFAMALGALHASPLAVAAEYAPVAGPSTSIRVIHSEPDVTGNLGLGKIVAASHSFSIRAVDVEMPKDGDEISFMGRLGARNFRLVGEAMLDTEGVSWTIGADEIIGP